MHCSKLLTLDTALQLAFCIQLLAKGNTVVALARDPDSSEGLKAIAHKKLFLVKADLSDAASLEVKI